MEKPLHLTDSQLGQISSAAFPLPPSIRDQFRGRVLAVLGERREIGDGEVFRACRAIQREMLAPPIRDNPSHTGIPLQLRKLDRAR